MITVNDLTATPSSIDSTIENNVSFSWTASVDVPNDNPVTFVLEIENTSKVYFKDDNGNLLKRVSWVESNVPTVNTPYQKTMTVVVSPSGMGIGVTKVFLNATDNNGNISNDVCVITYN